MFVDDIGNVHVKWQNGSSLAVIPDVDSVAILTECGAKNKRATPPLYVSIP